MTHRCPAAGCSINAPSHMFMCARHWRMVPKPLQQAVYASYRTTGRLSDNHREAVRVVDAAIAGRTVALPPGTKALTIWQPWASLIILRAKPYEFRRWNFADKPHLAKLIGQRAVIHAGARPPRLSELQDVLARIDEGKSALDPAIARPFIEEQIAALKAKRPHNMPLAAAIGSAELGQPINVVDLFADQVADSDRLDEHMFGWPIFEVERFPEPIPAAGAQGFWNWS